MLASNPRWTQEHTWLLYVLIAGFAVGGTGAISFSKWVKHFFRKLRGGPSNARGLPSQVTSGDNSPAYQAGRDVVVNAPQRPLPAGRTPPNVVCNGVFPGTLEEADDEEDRVASVTCMTAAFRNDVITQRAEADSIVAHLSFSPRHAMDDTGRVVINEAAWVEHDGNSIYLGMGQTRHLVISANSPDTVTPEYVAIEMAFVRHFGRLVVKETKALAYGEWDLVIELRGEGFKQTYDCHGTLAATEHYWSRPVLRQSAFSQ
jgi:hypothetical protein